jgi:hypothetical protein
MFQIDPLFGLLVLTPSLLLALSLVRLFLAPDGSESNPRGRSP